MAMVVGPTSVLIQIYQVLIDMGFSGHRAYLY